MVVLAIRKRGQSKSRDDMSKEAMKMDVERRSVHRNCDMTAIRFLIVCLFLLELKPKIKWEDNVREAILRQRGTACIWQNKKIKKKFESSLNNNNNNEKQQQPQQQQQ